MMKYEMLSAQLKVNSAATQMLNIKRKYTQTFDTLHFKKRAIKKGP